MVLVDTHALIWWKSESKMLSRQAAHQIAKSETILVSPVSFLEMATLLRKSRIVLDRDPYDWFQDLLDEPTVAIAPYAPGSHCCWDD